MLEEEKKSILINANKHKKLKEVALKSGISMKNIVEMGIDIMLKRIKFPEEYLFDKK